MKTMKKKLLAGLAMGMLVSGMAGTSSASLMNNYSEFNAGYSFLNFDELADRTIVDNEYVSYGITVSGTLGNEGSGAASNVLAVNSTGAYSSPIYLGQPDNSWNGSVIFNFSGVDVFQFGGMLVDSSSSWLSVYDKNGNFLETAYGNGATWDFVGINTGTVAIGRAIFSGDFYAVDDVAFSGTNSVPVPAAILLFGTGLVGLAGSRVRRKKK